MNDHSSNAGENTRNEGAAGENEVHSISTVNSTSAQISIIGNVSQSDKSFKFPETMHKKQKRSFQYHLENF